MRLKLVNCLIMIDSCVVPYVVHFYEHLVVCECLDTLYILICQLKIMLTQVKPRQVYLYLKQNLKPVLHFYW